MLLQECYCYMSPTTSFGNHDTSVVELRNKTGVNVFVKYGISQSDIHICMERNSTGLASNSQGWVKSLLKQATISKGFMMFRVIYY